MIEVTFHIRFHSTTLTQNFSHNKILVPFENWLYFINGSTVTTPERGVLFYFYPFSHIEALFML